MARVLVLGGDGMVGHVMRIRLDELGHEVSAIARGTSKGCTAVDLENEAALDDLLAARRFDVVVNCVGVLIRESEADPLRAIRLNALLPRLLESRAVESGYRLIHVSSDCVFSGEHGPYREGDPRDANDVYGRTKALGEVCNGHDLTIRTSKVGPGLRPDGSGLFNWFMHQVGDVKGFTRVFWSGVTTVEMAHAVNWAIGHPISGLVHLTNNRAISKCDLLRLFRAIWGRTDTRIIEDDTKVQNRSLRCGRGDFVYTVPPYEEMLLALCRFMSTHAELYPHYEQCG